MGKFNYAIYVKNRLTGFEGAEERALLAGVADIQDYPDYARRQSLPSRKTPACTGPITYKDAEAVQRDITDFRAALQGVQPEDTFLSAASPGVIVLFLPNHYYPSDEAYLYALADAMKAEYEAIHQAGFLLQV